jgi:putative transposase
VLTTKGIREAFVIAFLNVKTRQVFLSPATRHPNEEWVVAQAEAFVKQAREQGLPVRYVQHDRDKKFTNSFDAALRSRHVKPVKNAYRSPNTNAFVERFIQSLQQECLDRFIVFGEKHLDHLCAEYLAHYHQERPHQGEGIDNELLCRPEEPGRPKASRGDLHGEIFPLAEVRCKQRLGGLLKSYSRKAA